MSEKFRKAVESASIGSIVPVFREFSYTSDPVEYFSRLSENGRRKNCILLESADIVEKVGEKSMGTGEPCLNLRGLGERFEINALNSIGERFISALKGKLDFCDSVSYGKREIKGRLKPLRRTVSEAERLKLKTHADIIRQVAFAFKPPANTEIPFPVYGGLFGLISYDFIDQFEDLPPNKSDPLKEPDYELNFVDSLFLMDHRKKKTYLVSNALKTDDNPGNLFNECQARLDGMQSLLESVKNTNPLPAPTASAQKPGLKTSTDTPKKEFMELVGKTKEHVVAGDVFQIVVSRTITADCRAEPLEVYKSLRALNPSPYMFFMNDSSGVLLGASPEKYIGVERKNGKTIGGNGKRVVEIRPIAGTRPRGFKGGKIDAKLDAELEEELKADEKELAEHVMLVDLARNDVARVSRPGTRHVVNPFSVEKYSHVMHLVSSVQGELRPGLDALHAYLASMNMGTLTGAPKVEAMKLIRRYEKTRRGHYGGSVAYITPDGELDSAIVIRSMRLKQGKAHIRVGAGIVYDSVPAKEFEETENKAGALLAALEKTKGC